MRLTVPSLPSSLATAASETADARPEHVDPRPRGPAIAALVAGGHAVAVDPQHRVAGLRRPAGGGHREPGLVGGGDDRRGRRRSPRAAVCRRRCARASAAGSRAVDVGRLEALGRRATSPIRMTCAPPAGLGAGRARARRARRCGRRRAASSPSENSTGARSGGVEQLGAAMPARQSLASTSTTAAGRVLGRARGIDGLRHAGGVGDRVGAAHARRVLGREDREAEVGAAASASVALAAEAGLSSAARPSSRVRFARTPRVASSDAAGRARAGGGRGASDAATRTQRRATAARGQHGRHPTRVVGRLHELRARSWYSCRAISRTPGVEPGNGGPSSWGESRPERRGGAGSFSASPSANPAGRRKRVRAVRGIRPVDYACCCWSSRLWRRAPAAAQHPPTRGRAAAPAPAAGAGARRRRSRLRRRLPSRSCPARWPSCCRRHRRRARPTRRPGPAGDLGRQHARQDALPPTAAATARLHRPRLRLLRHRLLRAARRAACSTRPLDSGSLHALGRARQGPLDHGLHEPRPRLRRDRRAAPGHERRRRSRAAARARAGARTCARRAATRPATRSACS